MTPAEAADLFEAIAGSLKGHPEQFNIRVNVAATGQQINYSGSGIGMQINTTGGAAGSNTIGQQVSNLGSADIEIARTRGKEAMNEQQEALINALYDIAAGIRAGKADKSAVMATIESMAGTWIPPVIVAVLSKIATALFA